MVSAKPTIVELDMDKLEQILRRLDAKELDAEDYETIKAVLGSYVYLFNMVGAKETTIRRLRQILFGAKTEKTEAVVGGLKDTDHASASQEGRGRVEAAPGDQFDAAGTPGALGRRTRPSTAPGCAGYPTGRRTGAACTASALPAERRTCN